MDREILFRGKRVDNGKWIEGYFVKYQPCASENKFIVGIVPEYASALYIIEVIPETVGRYTGLTDRNGVKIFEGDVVEYHTDYDGLDGFTKEVDVRATVVWDNDCASFGCIIIGGEPDEFFPWFEMREEPPMEIIGNIHDNPELVK